MFAVYPACFYKEKNGMFSVIFPDLNNLATCGDSLNNAMSMAVDCLAGYLHSLQIENEVIPSPSELDNVTLDNDEDYEQAFVNLVSVDVNEYASKHFAKAVKKTLTIPGWLNDIAVKKGVNFSQTLQNALIEQLHINR